MIILWCALSYHGKRTRTKFPKQRTPAVSSSKISKRKRSVCGDRGNGIFLTVTEKELLKITKN